MNELFKTDEEYMQLAITEAKKALLLDEVPIGAIVVNDTGEIISRAYNLRETLKSPSAHAEFLAIETACKRQNSWRLPLTIYVTLEPCIMCSGLMHQCRIKKCVFGAYDKKAGGLASLYNINKDDRLNHTFEVVGGICGNECANLLKNFFRSKR